MNSPWHSYQKCLVVSLQIGDFIFIAYAQKRLSESCKRDTGLSRCHALPVCILALILLVGSSHQAHYKLRNLCFTFTPCLLDAYRLRPKRRIPALCVTYSHLSDDKFLCQNVGLGNSTQHGRRSVRDEGTTSLLFSA